MKERILYFDIVKAFAVLLMITGHVVATYDPRGYIAPLNVWIYSFHMPLFMILSGVFFGQTFKKDFKEILKSKVILLLIPLCSWSLVNLVLGKLFQTNVGSWSDVIRDYIYSGGPLHGLWYFKCLFMYLIVCSLSIKLIKNEFLAMILTLSLFILLPDVNFSSIMIPFFWLGYFSGNFLKKPVNPYVVAGAGILMLLTFVFWKPEYSYINKNKIPISYFINFITGASSSFFWILLFKKILESKKPSRLLKWTASVGMSSLGIYASQEYFYYPHFWGWIFDGLPKKSAIVYIIYSFIILLITYGLVALLKKNKWIPFFMLGNSLKS